MSHKQEQTKRFKRHIYLVSIALALAGMLLTSSRLPTAHGFAADATEEITTLKSHGSFHYELTRVLARYAGFSKREAETIAVACEATDAATFSGYPIKKSGPGKMKEPVTITIKNTERQSKNNLFYHFARRSAQYAQVTSDTGSKANTCDYFINGDPKNPTKAPCKEKGPELDQIRNWALNLRGVKPDDSQLPTDAAGKAIKPKSLVALGVYVHSLGDSYSHEKCMVDEELRSHPPEPFPCSPVWHIKTGGEFGSDAQGIAFTQAAAFEVWRALRRYRKASEKIPPEVNEFIMKFTTTADACQRVWYAVETFNKLSNETTVIKCLDNAKAG